MTTEYDNETAELTVLELESMYELGQFNPYALLSKYDSKRRTDPIFDAIFDSAIRYGRSLTTDVDNVRTTREKLWAEISNLRQNHEGFEACIAWLDGYSDDSTG